MSDSDLSEAEQLVLLFKAGGLDVVKDAKDSFAHLTEEMKGTAKAADQVQEATKSVDTTTQQAVEILKSDSTVVEDLKQKIAELTAQQNMLRDSFVAGLIPSAHGFKETFDALGDSIADKQGILERATGEGEGESGKGGLKGIAGAAVKAEKAIGMLASGGGLGRLPNMLEGVAGALGLASGAGLAAGGLILAFESIIPKIEKFIEKISGAGEAAKRTAEKVKEAQDQMAKFMAEGTEEEEEGAKAVKPLLAHGGGKRISQGVEQVLRQRLAPDERLFLEQYESAKAAGIEQAPYIEEQAKALQDKLTGQRGTIMEALMAGKTPAISEVSGMASQFPGLFPTGTEQRFRQALPENIEAAKKQAQKAEADSAWADTTHAKREAARKENLAIQDEFDKALVDRRKHQDKQFESTMRSDEAFAKKTDKDLDKDEREATRQAREAERDAERAARKAKTEAARRARESTPEAIEHRALAAQRNEEMGMAQQVQSARAGMGDTMAAQMGPAELQQVVAQVGKNRLMNSSLGFTLAQQVDYYMGQLEAKMVADFTRGMGQHDRSAQNINPVGGY
jgi:hypothetical protein